MILTTTSPRAMETSCLTYSFLFSVKKPLALTDEIRAILSDLQLNVKADSMCVA